ncbi:cell division protein FtsK [Bacillus sp. V3B]|uniref:FtsK/SpoIIIE domain-containing protein n=1 Tax=Bacillus sp. V3B TaxID=2804915 RepID=UPI00210CA8BD|nr:FtsK/SpoIIIE domain-containing protein [Bacillus sp. V3B]MCQ6275738.1 cell division protein FtsK [Bacillus sp. V3B]
MIVELATSVIAGGLMGFSYYQQKGNGSDDAKKIQRICQNNSLTVKEDGKIKNIQLLRKTKIKDDECVIGKEYAYRIPLGLSFKDFEDKREYIQDGINNKQTSIPISFEDLKKLKLDRKLLKNIKSLLNQKKTVRKEIELSYDGVLKIRVYDEPLTKKYDYEKGLTSGWIVPVGKNRKGLIVHDFEKKAHIIVAGTTDFGKSNWVNSTINTLLLNKPEDATFTLIDLKGGLEFNRYRQIKQVKSYATNVEEAKEALQASVDQMDKITSHLLEKGYSNVKEAGFKERHFIVIDEAADMADNKECQELLKDIARKGRASGLRLVYTTQYPTAETISSQVKRNCIGRLCFVLDTVTASTVVLDQGGAEKLPPIQGRALYKDLGLNEVQTPYISSEMMNEIIGPNINIRTRKDDQTNEDDDHKGTTARKHTLITEEIGLS